MALFGKKKPDEPKPSAASGNGAPPPAPPAPAAAGEAGEPKYRVQADKAARFFGPAKTVHDTTNYEYAMQLWINGLRLDPTNMQALEGFFASAGAYAAETKGKGQAKDVRKDMSGRGELERFLSSILEWGLRPLEADLGVRAVDASAKLQLGEQTYWLGERAMNAIAREKKPRKDLYVRLMKAFEAIGAFEKAVQAGEAAVALDKFDGKLAAEVRNLAAQATMSKGGYDQTGQAGGFRANIRDAEKQRLLDEGDRIVKTEDTLDRLLVIAREDYRGRPDDPSAINVYAKRLRERGRPEDEKEAYKILTLAYEKTKQFRFRAEAGDIKLRQAERKLQEYKDAAAANPDDAIAVESARRATIAFTKMQVDEYRARLEAYPTDLGLKFELGRRLFDLGQYDEAIPLFQDAKDDAKRRVEALNYLAQAFERSDFNDGAIETYRQALEFHKVLSDEMGMALRYGLLTSLQTRAEKEQDLAAAEEADKLASAIAIQQYNYRDVRARRDAIKKLLTDLRRGGGAAAG